MIDEDRAMIPTLVGGALVTTAIGAYAYFSHRKHKKTLVKILKDREQFRLVHEAQMKLVKEHLDRSAERHHERMESIIKPLRDQGLLD
jgi:predicted nucleotidyltransferase